MKKEKSCGAVIYKIVDNIPYFLIQKMSLGHISLCKGHMEENETEIETAKREILEETSLEVEIEINFKETITYSPKKGVIKDVVFFIATPIDKNKEAFDEHDDEVVESNFYRYKEAYSLLTYEADKSVLEKAYKYLLENNKI